jgi:transposase
VHARSALTARFVLDVVAELDLTGFLSGYRADGRGGAAYEPAMTLAGLIYAYCAGERSSRRIERRLVEDVAFRVVGAGAGPRELQPVQMKRRSGATRKPDS